MIPLFALTALVGLAVVTAGVTLAAGWLTWVIGLVGALVALVAAGSFGFFIWGKQVGFNWHFTP